MSVHRKHGIENITGIEKQRVNIPGKTGFHSIIHRATDKEHSFISIMPIFTSNPMFEHLLESSHQDDSNKMSNIGFCEEIMQVSGLTLF